MAETVQGLTVQVRIWGTVNGDDGAKLTVDETYTKTFSEGTGTNNIGYVWQDETRSLDTTSEDLQLDGLTDFQGATMSSNNNVKLLYVRNLDTTSGDYFRLGGSSGGNEWDSGPLAAAGDKIDIEPDGILLCVSPVDGWGITAGDDLGMEAADTSTYRILLAGDNA